MYLDAHTALLLNQKQQFGTDLGLRIWIPVCIFISQWMYLEMHSKMSYKEDQNKLQKLWLYVRWRWLSICSSDDFSQGSSEDSESECESESPLRKRLKYRLHSHNVLLMLLVMDSKNNILSVSVVFLLDESNTDEDLMLLIKL